MASVKLTKNELKVQKDKLKQFQRYLPTLELKKQQLQTVMMKITAELQKYQEELSSLVAGLDDWGAVFSENTLFSDDKKLETLVKPKSSVCVTENIAGVTVPVFKELTFEDIHYEISDYPLWVDEAIFKLRDIARLNMLLKTLKIHNELLGKELRFTSQRVNLFEKEKIPEAKNNIRQKSIYLGDQQTSAVVRGKIAKKKRQEASV